MASGWIRTGSLLTLLLVWQVAVWLWQPAALPGPAEVLQRIWQQLLSGEMLQHLLVTLRRVALAFAGAMALGLPLGLLMAHYPRLDACLDAPLTVLLNIPALVVIILCFLWLGLNEWAALAAVIINKTPTVAVTMREGGKARDPDLLAVARAFDMGRWRAFRAVYLPQQYPYILAAARSGLALVWKIVLVVELLGCSEGVGFQLGIYFQYFDIAGILAYTAVFVALILLLEAQVVRRWERRIMRWRQ